MVTAFAAAMAKFAPFERSPHLAVAVSGGADSMALCLLADDWARARGGMATALTIDHGLRPASAEEARRVGGWLARRGIEHRVLRWEGGKPTSAIQEAARVARYRLLCRWCREANVLHLLVGHHADDQAETVLYRVVRGSGIDGLAAMSAVVDRAELRILRPLLSCSAAALRSMLRERSQDWLEDPSNQDARFARTRLRALEGELAAAGLAAPVLLAARRQMEAARAVLEDAIALLLARSCRVHPTGSARIDREVFAAAPSEIAARALRRVVAMVGGTSRESALRSARAALRLVVHAQAPATTTLGRCLVLVRHARVFVFRERRNLPAPCMLRPGAAMLWDGRFRLTSRTPTLLCVRPFERSDWQICGARKGSADRDWSGPLVCTTVPVLSDGKGFVELPYLSLAQGDPERKQSQVVEVLWYPRIGITGRGYFLD